MPRWPVKRPGTRFTFDVFTQRVVQRHGDRFELPPAVEWDSEWRRRSKVPVKCRECGYAFERITTDLMDKDLGCKRCSNRAEWTYDRFIEEAHQLYGTEMFDYSQVTPAHITGSRSKIPVKCKTCGYEWEPSILVHINAGAGCKCCLGECGLISGF